MEWPIWNVVIVSRLLRRHRTGSGASDDGRDRAPLTQPLHRRASLRRRARAKDGRARSGGSDESDEPPQGDDRSGERNDRRAEGSRTKRGGTPLSVLEAL